MYDVYVTGSGVVDSKGEMFPVTRGDIIRYNQLCGQSFNCILYNFSLTENSRFSESEQIYLLVNSELVVFPVF